MQTFYEVQRDVWLKFGYRISELTNADQLRWIDQMKGYINDAGEIVYRYKMPWMMRNDGLITTKAQYNTGTITATNGSTTVTGAGTTWTRDMKDQKMIITDSADGVVVYRIAEFVSATSLTLEGEYIETGGAGMSYEIQYDTYDLPIDFKTLEVMKDFEQGDAVRTYFHDDQYMLEDYSTTALPSDYIFLGINRSNYYDTGTADVTNNSTTVTGNGTSWDSTMIGRYIQLDNHSRYYRITAVAGAGSLTIDKVYGGATGATVKYAIGPVGILQLRFLQAPEVAKRIPFSYYPKWIRLEANNDISPIPSDNILKLGAIWLWYQNEDSPLAEVAKANFEQAVRRLISIEPNIRQETFEPVYDTFTWGN
jgi:hypothetical protein